MERQLVGAYRLQQYIDVIQRANQIAATTELDELLDQMLTLIIEVTEAQAGTLYLYDADRDELEFKLVKGDEASQILVGKRISAQQGIAGRALRVGEAIFVPDVSNDPSWDRQTGELSRLYLQTMYCLPLQLHQQPIGVVQVFNLPEHTIDTSATLSLLQLLGGRLVTEVEKARLLAQAQRRERRQSALVDIISHITTTLDRDELLNRIMRHATNLLEVEATSIWEQDEETGDLVLHVATGTGSARLSQTRVPAGAGIIGYVTRTGELVVSDDVRNDTRFYSRIDETTGFVTRSILCVPLRAPNIQLGDERGSLHEAILGGAQAINKRNGKTFSDEDISLFETLASQAATVLRLSHLYEDTSKLFFGIIKAVTSAIDLKDPYTRGHSQRVADFSVAIAHELGLSDEDVYNIRIGGMLHDVGKIGVSDTILKKPNRLTDSEMDEMKRHPDFGVKVLEDAELQGLLRAIVPALAQHHERLDGRGYPRGLRGDAISQIGRIVAVADAFDAMTSDRPYRPGMAIETALRILRDGSGHEYDAVCVQALIAALEHGRIIVAGNG